MYQVFLHFSQVEDLTKSYVSLVIPLYVSYVFHSVSSPGAWQHYDLSSQQRVTFVYDTALLLKQGISNIQSDGTPTDRFEVFLSIPWHLHDVMTYLQNKQCISSSTILVSCSDLSGRLYLQSMKIQGRGNLLVKFQTQTNFYGKFLLKDGNSESSISSADRSQLGLSLELLNSEQTFSNPKQIWQFVSDSAVSV